MKQQRTSLEAPFSSTILFSTHSYANKRCSYKYGNFPPTSQIHTPRFQFTEPSVAPQGGGEEICYVKFRWSHMLLSFIHYVYWLRVLRFWKQKKEDMVVITGGPIYMDKPRNSYHPNRPTRKVFNICQKMTCTVSRALCSHPFIFFVISFPVWIYFLAAGAHNSIPIISYLPFQFWCL